MADKSADKEETPLVEHARREMEFVGLFDVDADYGGMIPNAVLELMNVFSKQGHSGYSASLVASLWYRLAQFKPLTDVTLDPAEWMDVSENILPPEKIKAGEKIWQNIRDGSVFSTDGGKTWKNYESNTEGKSITKEEALYGIGKGTEEAEDNDQDQTDQSQGSDGGGKETSIDSTPGVKGKPAPESKDSKDAGPAKEPRSVEGVKSTVATPQRPDSPKGKVK